MAPISVSGMKNEFRASDTIEHRYTFGRVCPLVPLFVGLDIEKGLKQIELA